MSLSQGKGSRYLPETRDIIEPRKGSVATRKQSQIQVENHIWSIFPYLLLTATNGMSMHNTHTHAHTHNSLPVYTIIKTDTTYMSIACTLHPPHTHTHTSLTNTHSKRTLLLSFHF